MHWSHLLVGLGMMCGTLIAAQGAINGKLSATIGGPLQAAVISFSVGLTALILANLVMGNRFALTHTVSSLPWWGWVGGLFGAIMVASSAMAVPRIGVAAWVVAVIAGQLIAAVIYDQLGAFGQDVRPITPLRLLGVGFLVLGVYLVRRF
ncbi:MAG: hypothetical protein CMK09_12000 [Ponticaulis sp.]|nr:hypothetical protein [Ponticaulis sp.]|tara:strand:+ start:38190 stop:38639 length:450 start_codon:yes stop_codon:yes gene_type:complete